MDFPNCGGALLVEHNVECFVAIAVVVKATERGIILGWQRKLIFEHAFAAIDLIIFLFRKYRYQYQVLCLRKSDEGVCLNVFLVL